MPPLNHRWAANQSQVALLEYASVQQSCPPGVFVSTTPGSPSSWQGVYFVRKGTYANSVLRFHVSIPGEFPEYAPSVTFSTEIFHPLVTPLSTQTFSNASPLPKPQKAGDELRLAPGSLNLGYGFPEWFRRRGLDGMATTMERRVHEAMSDTPSLAQSMFGEAESSGDEYGQDTPSKRPSRPSGGGITGMGGAARKLMFIPPPAVDALEYSSTRSYSGMATVLEYMVQAFEDDEFLDGVGDDDAANPSAMFAWNAHRQRVKEAEELKRLRAKEKERNGGNNNGTGSGANTPRHAHRNSLVPGSTLIVREGDARLQGQSPRNRQDPRTWDWNGVWLERVRKCVKDSTSDATLFKEGAANTASAGRDDDVIEMVRFLDVEKDAVGDISSQIRFTKRNSAMASFDALAEKYR